MKLTAELAKRFHCPRWEQLPAISLYMDQVVIMLEEILGAFADEKERVLTSTMINNYVKQKIITPPEKKKYDRGHLALLIMISTLKKVLSMSEISSIIAMMVDAYGMDAAYDLFCEKFEKSLANGFSGHLEHVRASANPGQGQGALNILEAGLTALTGKLLVLYYLQNEMFVSGDDF